MFSKNYLIMILFVGSLLSSDNGSEKGVRFDIRPILKKIVIPGLVGIAVSVLSEKTVFVAPVRMLSGKARFLGPDKNLYLARALLKHSDWLVVIGGNFKLICILLSQADFDCHSLKMIKPSIISVENGQRICTLISGLHGLAGAAACRYGLNRFFPG